MVVKVLSWFLGVALIYAAAIAAIVMGAMAAIGILVSLLD